MQNNSEEQKTNQKFNFNAKRVFLTYPQSNLDMGQIRDRLLSLLQTYCIAKWVIGREKHADGGTHYHACFIFATKLHTREVRYFDLEGEHPNIRNVDNPERVRDYCRKGGDYEEDWTYDRKGYRNAKADDEAYDRDLYFKSLTKAIPFELPDETFFTEDMLDSKKRHYWFKGPADWGKTTWVEETFEGKAIYKRTETSYPFDDYCGQQVIIYDDFFPKLAELLNVSNTYRTLTPVYGDTRYNKKYWPIRQNRVIIVLTNELPEYCDVESFLARFNIKIL